MRTVIISHNNDPLYSFFEPIVKWAWQKVGWDCVCIIEEGITESQCIRLYQGGSFDPDTLLMTSDIDMLPLSDYWNPKDNETTSYGRDLSHEHFPICYVAMPAKLWKAGFGDRGEMLFDIKVMGKRWVLDQDILTHRMGMMDVTYIDRGLIGEPPMPIGRIDRYCWDLTLQQLLRIDAHLLRPGYTDENWPRIMSLIKECLNPTEQEIEWLENYRTEWIKSH